MTDEEERAWGPWSVWKTEILLGGYLPLFALAAQGATHRTFIDCFAGVTRNVERATGREIKSSPYLALETSPPFTHLVAFEEPDKATALESVLLSIAGDRSIRVIGGDCNERITEGLDWWFNQRVGMRGPYLGPTLAYLDPNSLQLSWSTVEVIARFGMTPHRPGAWIRQKGPIELLILFPTGPLKRSLPQAGRRVASDAAQAKIDRLFGSDSWRPIYQDQRAGVTMGEGSWMHYVNLYRRQLQGLGYRYTAAIEVRNTAGVVLYHMVFATGHDAGKRIMTSVMDRARQILPRLLEEEKRRLREGSDGTASLFAGNDEFAEAQEIAVHPERYARLITDPPTPYVPGRPPDPPPEQLELI